MSQLGHHSRRFLLVRRCPLSEQLRRSWLSGSTGQPEIPAYPAGFTKCAPAPPLASRCWGGKSLPATGCGRPQRHRGVPRARHDGVGRRRGFALSAMMASSREAHYCARLEGWGRALCGITASDSRSAWPCPDRRRGTSISHRTGHAMPPDDASP